MPYTLNISLTIQDPLARDLTRYRMSQRAGLTTLSAAIDGAVTALPLNSLQGISAGQQLLCENELMTVTAVDTTVHVTRGDTSILSTAGAAAHAAGSGVVVLQYASLEAMGVAVAQADAWSKINALGQYSETKTGFIS